MRNMFQNFLLASGVKAGDLIGPEVITIKLLTDLGDVIAESSMSVQGFDVLDSEPYEESKYIWFFTKNDDKVPRYTGTLQSNYYKLDIYFNSHVVDTLKTLGEVKIFCDVYDNQTTYESSFMRKLIDLKNISGSYHGTFREYVATASRDYNLCIRSEVRRTF